MVAKISPGDFESRNLSHNNELSAHCLRVSAAKMNLPAASRGVSMNDNFYPNAASCEELNPADLEISTAHSL